MSIGVVVSVLPVNVLILVHRDHDIFRLRHRGDIAIGRKGERNQLRDHRDGDEEDDQQHQHHVDQRGRVDGGVQRLLGIRHRVLRH